MIATLPVAVTFENKFHACLVVATSIPTGEAMKGGGSQE